MMLTQLTQRRTQAGLSQAELARRLNVGRATVNGWEHGNRTPNLEFLVAIASVLNCTIDDLVAVNPSQASAEA